MTDYDLLSVFQLNLETQISVRLLFTSFFGAVNIRVRLFEGATLHSLVMFGDVVHLYKKLVVLF